LTASKRQIAPFLKQWAGGTVPYSSANQKRTKETKMPDRDRKSSSGRQQGDVSRGLQRQQSQEINRTKSSGSGSSRKQQQMNRTHRSQQR
jgi:hypothetical protein